jgi:hypothetical protein
MLRKNITYICFRVPIAVALKMEKYNFHKG